MWRPLIFVAVLIALTNGECRSGCDQPVAIYKDLRCIPVYAKPDDCCPVKYDCSAIAKRPKDKCTYRGKSYAIGEDIPREETYGNCRIGCRCSRAEHITCAILDCPEWLGARPKTGSHFTYALNECCSIGQKAAPFATCKVGDVEYKEGQKFDADERCTQCVCKKNWAGKFVAPFCTEQSCAEEMTELPKIKANCAPSYLGNKPCCPFRWICPNDEKADDKIIPAPSASKGHKEQCKYGSKLVNVGEKFERIEPVSQYEHFEIKCECVIPPFLTCMQKQVFDKVKTPQHIKDALGLKD